MSQIELFEKDPLNKIFVDKPKPVFIEGRGMMVLNSDIQKWLVSHLKDFEELAKAYQLLINIEAFLEEFK